MWVLNINNIGHHLQNVAHMNKFIYSLKMMPHILDVQSISLLGFKSVCCVLNQDRAMWSDFVVNISESQSWKTHEHFCHFVRQTNEKLLQTGNFALTLKLMEVQSYILLGTNNKPSKTN